MSRWLRFKHFGRTATRPTRLSVETLDAREVPGALTRLDGYRQDAQMKAAAADNQAPVISNFRAIAGPHGRVTFVGSVSDDQAVAGDVVRISGLGIDLTAVVDSDGTFTVTTIATGPSDVLVTAEATDGDGATSDPAYTTFTPSD